MFFGLKIYKNTTKVDLPEVDFSLHEDNPKLKEVSEVIPHNQASFMKSCHSPRSLSI